MILSKLPVVGVGLAVAAQLVARGETPIVFEAGDTVGHSILQWARVHAFAPWRYCTDKLAASMLASARWTHPDPEDVPSRREPIALFGFQSGAALATVVGVLAEVPVMQTVVKFVRGSQDWYEAGVRRVAKV